MADLEIALPPTLDNEGFYGNDPADPGGETLWGIARNKNPKWEGWTTVDSLKGTTGFPSCMKTNELLLKYRHEFYAQSEWAQIRGDEIVDQSIANLTFDMAVNKGVAIAIEYLQQSAGIPETGIMDDATLNAINNPNV